MRFRDFFESGEQVPKQQLFPWMTEEDPVNVRSMKRHTSYDSYLKSKLRGARDTERAATAVTSATPNGFMSGTEVLQNLYPCEVVIPPKAFSNGVMRPEYYIGFVHLHKTDALVNGMDRLLAVWQGTDKKLNAQEIMAGNSLVIGGIVFRGPYLTHTWVDPQYKDYGLYKLLREFARKYFGVVGTAPDDKLKSRSYLTAQAKYDWKRYQGLLK